MLLFTGIQTIFVITKVLLWYGLHRTSSEQTCNHLRDTISGTTQGLVKQSKISLKELGHIYERKN